MNIDKIPQHDDFDQDDENTEVFMPDVPEDRPLDFDREDPREYEPEYYDYEYPEADGDMWPEDGDSVDPDEDFWDLYEYEDRFEGDLF